MLRTIARYGLAAIVLNEVRGIVMAAPVMAAMWRTGGTWMHAWLLFCLALSVVVPVVIWRTTAARASFVALNAKLPTRYPFSGIFVRNPQKQPLKSVDHGFTD